MNQWKKDDRAFARVMKSQYYCPCCGHTTFFHFGEFKKTCRYCGTIVERKGKSVYDINLIKRLKTYHKIWEGKNDNK